MAKDFHRAEFSFKGGKYPSDINGAISVITGLAITLMDYGWKLKNTWDDSLNNDGEIAYVLMKHASGLKACFAMNVSSVPESFRTQCLPADMGKDECGQTHLGQYAGGLMCSVIPPTSDEEFSFIISSETGKCLGIQKPYQSTPFVGTVGARNRMVKSFLDINRVEEYYSYIIVSDGYTVYGFSHKLSDGDALRGFACGSLMGEMLYASRETSYCARYLAIRMSLDGDENNPSITDCGIGATDYLAYPLHTKKGVAYAACMTANYNMSAWVPCHLHIDEHYLSLKTYVPAVLGKDRFSRVAVFAGYSEDEADPYTYKISWGDTLKGYLDTERFVMTSPNSRPIGTLYNNNNMVHVGGGVLIGYADGGALLPVKGEKPEEP